MFIPVTCTRIYLLNGINILQGSKCVHYTVTRKDGKYHGAKGSEEWGFNSLVCWWQFQCWVLELPDWHSTFIETFIERVKKDTKKEQLKWLQKWNSRLIIGERKNREGWGEL